jgi:hypothetical protein
MTYLMVFAAAAKAFARKSFLLTALASMAAALLFSHSAVAQSVATGEALSATTPAAIDAPSTLLIASASVPDGGLPHSAPDTSSHIDRITETGMVRAAFVMRRATSRTCASGEASAKSCGEHWQPLLRQSFELLLLQSGGDIAFDRQARYNTFHGHWLSHYLDSAGSADLTRWTAGDDSAADYLKQPLMGAVTSFLYIQNDPRGRDFGFQNTRPYWMSRLRATLYSTAYEAEWKLGPIGDASLGNYGRQPSSANRGATHAPGAMDFVMMPAGGVAWSIGEDVIDRQIIWRLEGKTNNRAALWAISMLNPGRSVANILRNRAPWYRDSREKRTSLGPLPFAGF